MRDYAVQFLANGAYFAAVLFLPLYARDPIGASDSQIGIISAGASFAGFLSSVVFGRLADVRGRRQVLLAGLAASAGTAFLQALAGSTVVLGLTWFAFGFAFGSFGGALLGHAYEAGRRIGRFSSFGSLGWGFGTFLSGTVVAALGLDDRWSFVLAGLLFLVALAFACGIRFGPEVRLHVPRIPLAVIRRNWPAYAAILVRHTGGNMIWVTFPLFLAEDLRLSKFDIGILYTVNAGTQFLFMLLATDRVRSTRLVFVGLLLSSITFFSFTLARNFWEMFATQVLLGLSWACLYVGSLAFVLQRGVERSTSSGLLNSAISISAILGALFGGILAQATDYEVPMYVAAVMAVVSIGVFACALRRVNSKGPAAPA